MIFTAFYSTSPAISNYPASLESADSGVEYLFMGGCNWSHGQSAQNNRDYEYIRIIYLLNQLKPDKTSGRYWQDRCRTTH
ncbi:MAG: hypothetical protein WBA41_13925 [Rivularia sp. (in: cyanobacteria)]